MIKVSYIKSDDRIYNIERCLALIKSEITAGLKNAGNIVIKPTCPVVNNQLASTHLEALYAVINFIQPFVKGQIILAGNSSNNDTMTAFMNYGYFKLQEKFDLAVVDLDTDETDKIDVNSADGTVQSVRIARTLARSDYLISVSPPKTDGKLNYTGAITNVAALTQPKSSKQNPIGKGIFHFFHGDRNVETTADRGLETTAKNILQVYEKLPLKLAIVDGFEVMAGDGPIDGEMVPAHFAIASTNPLAADWLACKCLGIPIEGVTYLSLLDQKENMNYFVAGDEWQKNVLEIKMPQNYIKNRQG